MKHIFKSISIFILLAVLLASLPHQRVIASKANLEEGSRVNGLSASDWSQIRSLLPPTPGLAPDFQQAYVKASNTDQSDSFYVVAVSGNTVVVGAPLEDGRFSQNDNLYKNAGAVYVFIRIGNTWTQQGYLKASNVDAGDQFGKAVAIDGNTIVVGAPYEASKATGVNGDETNNDIYAAGAAYVFTRDDTNWSQQAYLKASHLEPNDFISAEFGYSVAISGDTLAVGAIYESSNATGVNGDETNILAPNSGAAYVFVRSDTTWSQEAYIKASNTDSNDQFGYSLSISGDTLAVGAPFEASNATGVGDLLYPLDEADNSASGAGAAYVFTRNGTTWLQEAYLKASNTDIDDRFGYSVTTSADTIVAGAPQEASSATGVNGDETDNSASGAGAAYVFTRNGTTWSQEAYLKASNTDSLDYFGWSVAAYGDLAAISAYREASNATGVGDLLNPLDEADNSATGSGAAYIFSRDVTNWSQVRYLKASNAEANDQFGYFLAMYGDVVAVGAPFEDSGATGINSTNDGNEGNDPLFDSGAVYIFSAYNQAPIDITLNGNTIDENQPAGTIVGTFTSTDPNVGDTFTYSFCGGTDDASFSITGDSLEAAASFDYETQSSLSICVRSTDIGLLTFDQTLTVYVNDLLDTATFADVPPTYWSWIYIEALYQSGITGGCSTIPLTYCPEKSVTRAQMAVFLEKAMNGSSFTVPIVDSTFIDTDGHWAKDWIEALKVDGITSGCDVDFYCPDQPVTRAQMAVFLLKAKNGTAFVPPAPTEIFMDVPSTYWAAAWIEELAAEHITSGCDSFNYCPDKPVTRAQMAVFLQKTFGLPLP